jgi:2-polyprenyl-3-methyl-5-hydroxy-6-metoxy-1,4-benzoquinol methylase
VGKKKPITNSDVVDFLSSTTANATFLQRLKIKYRPYVCPFDELLAYAHPEDTVYDIGCGSGQFAALVANFTDVETIKGIEVDKHLVQNAKEINKRFGKNKKMSFSYFSGSVIPKDIGKYDLIYMIDVYHHIPLKIRDDFMKQIYSKMKPGARLMFKDINAGSPFIPFNKVHDMVFAQEYPHEISFYKAVQLMTSLGFKIIEGRKKRVFIYPHYFILAQK